MHERGLTWVDPRKADPVLSQARFHESVIHACGLKSPELFQPYAPKKQGHSRLSGHCKTVCVRDWKADRRPIYLSKPLSVNALH